MTARANFAIEGSDNRERLTLPGVAGFEDFAVEPLDRYEYLGEQVERTEKQLRLACPMGYAACRAKVTGGRTQQSLSHVEVRCTNSECPLA